MRFNQRQLTPVPMGKIFTHIIVIFSIGLYSSNICCCTTYTQSAVQSDSKGVTANRELEYGLYRARIQAEATGPDSVEEILLKDENVRATTIIREDTNSFSHSSCEIWPQPGCRICPARDTRATLAYLLEARCGRRVVVESGPLHRKSHRGRAPSEWTQQIPGTESIPLLRNRVREITTVSHTSSITILYTSHLRTILGSRGR